MKDNIKLVAFDADDTLWDNQSYYCNAEKVLCSVLSEYASEYDISSALLKTETMNMPALGYGAKAFTISLMETALEVSGGRLSGNMMMKILNAGKSVLEMSAEPFPGVMEVLVKLAAAGKYRLVVFTKGDLLDQQNKLSRSGLEKYFCHAEIVSDKTAKEYRSLCCRMGVSPDEFMMVGNSFKSDIAPVLEIGGYGVYIPFEHTWQHEVAEEYDHARLMRVSSFTEIADLLL